MTRTARLIFEVEDVKQTVNKLRQAGRRIVLTQGSFDLVHIGHARYCQKAKSFGDVLIVGVDSDQKVKVRKAAIARLCQKTNGWRC